MVMNEMVQRVMDVLIKRGVQMVQKEDAIAIFQAIREPNWHMKSAALNWDWYGDPAGSEAPATPETVWQAMIDAAMEDGDAQAD
jgi:hypothetical protein